MLPDSQCLLTEGEARSMDNHLVYNLKWDPPICLIYECIVLKYIVSNIKCMYNC